jgi:hypothetical protein
MNYELCLIGLGFIAGGISVWGLMLRVESLEQFRRDVEFKIKVRGDQ